MYTEPDTTVGEKTEFKWSSYCDHLFLYIYNIIIWTIIAIMIACVASVPVPPERNSGCPKEFFRIRAARKMRREQKSERRGVGEGKGGNACPQTPRF